MNPHALLIYTRIRHAHIDSPESARRREPLLRLERETARPAGAADPSVSAAAGTF